ncbi:hypothetical protein [Streptomyces sp. NPDC051572]|uniref:hypothetical protein n=1 Tax=Streptomyces sp. NPDC051572 TaxID=3155802 RepID=UPI003450FEDB
MSIQYTRIPEPTEADLQALGTFFETTKGVATVLVKAALSDPSDEAQLSARGLESLFVVLESLLCQLEDELLNPFLRGTLEPDAPLVQTLWRTLLRTLSGMRGLPGFPASVREAIECMPADPTLEDIMG